MAQSARRSADVTGELSPDEQALLDADRDDAANASPAPDETNAAQAATQEDDASAAQPDPQAADPAQPADGQQQPRMVPHQALHEERQLRKAADDARKAAEERARLLEERTNLLLQRMGQPQSQQPTQQQPHQPQLPPVEQDPVGHLLGRIQQQDALMRELAQAMVGSQERQQQAEGAQVLRARASALEREFAAANPDYYEAVEHLVEAARGDLVLQGWTDPVEIQQALAAQTEALVRRAQQLGRNPAELAYELAQRRGYAKRQAQTAAAATPAAPAAADGTENIARGQQQLQNIARGQQQARNVGNLRGQGPAPLTAQRLAEMTEAEFSRMMETPEGRALLGA